ncbi:glycoside hydrolase family protein [Carboxylicivirga linearis]|uniref:Endo-polygalacturonase n=1 Tax=Carboxylicivirga linearis TaxID=1628157 RepID=A0ABS5JUW6_9BACT|nr:hypothetical protein [Carboxylicivirga linearis]MBS2098699.1 hypothetical protein [Carboxylicivirga linearis]
MKSILKILTFCIVLIIPNGNLIAERLLKTYVAPEGALLNDDFTVQVRLTDGKWQTIPTYLTKVDEVRNGKHTVEKSSMAFFDFNGKIEVKVTNNKGLISTSKVRPLSLDIQPQVSKKQLTFFLDQPQNLSIEVNGDIFHNLHLFANPIEDIVPDANDKNVIFFGKGIHNLEDGKLFVPSGKTVYIAGDAIVRGQIFIHNADNVKVIGRGMIEHTVKMGVHIANSKNVLVEGIFTTQCATGGSDSVVISNVKSISYFGWGDGLNVFASNNVLFDRVFCRNSDDCTTVYATRKGFNGASRNITMQNSVLWADVAHPIFIGIHGNADSTDVIENLLYKNIDILDHKEQQIDYQGCLAINGGDNNIIRNVRFENIRIENFRQGQLVNLRIFYNQKYCKAPGKSIENIYFKDISYFGDNAELSIISGYNNERQVKNVVFENLVINGDTIHDNMKGKPPWYKTSDFARIYIGEHAENIQFIKTDH